MMNIRSLQLLLSLLVGSTVVAWEHIDEDAFRRAIAGHNYALVAFIEPSTAASQALEPEWTSALEKEKKGLISIDCSSAPSLCREFDVISCPALRFFDGHGNTAPYRGPRRTSSILAYLKRAIRPIITSLDSDAKISAFQSSDDYTAIAQINPQDSHVKTAYETLASQYRDRVSFGLVEVTDIPTAVGCYNNCDSLQFTISDFTSIDALPKLIENCLEPVIGEFTRASEVKYLQSGKSLVFYFTTSPKDRDAYVDTMRSVAKMYKEYLSFVTVDANEYGDLTAPLGLAPATLPRLSVQNPMFGQVFPYPRSRKITPEAVGGFLMDIVQGKQKPWDGTFTADEAGGHARDEL
ncbi:thioredoxin-like domain-containing protein [Hypoxylon trugodes]|uniref:thioredoxin-like domain-containing protein n=1 Tax=Hypoxylon trugodes TaxID=326681 RepID=UPI00219527C2|nr:thioredoxin-like domain-containing protein [Hypoxylon trugodes]KAI1389169.1 thioredoxin-like domain-containing protein [Hypoxylon trugodes]